MAYNDTPLPTDLISDSQPDIRENFQLLEDSQVVDEGLTTDGDYIRYENGWQVCAGKTTLTYHDAENLRDSASLPQSFTTDGNLFTGVQLEWITAVGTLDRGDYREFGEAGILEAAANQVEIRFGNGPGARDFDETDEIDCLWFAIGRWK